MGGAPAAVFGPETGEAEVAAFVDGARPDDSGRAALAALLPEETGLYRGRGANQARRIRGYVLAAFGRVGLPAAAMPYVLEELESGTEPYLVAAAARALRGHPGRAAAAAPLLVRALETVRPMDEALSFEAYLPARPFARPTTAVGEVLRTLAWLGPDAAPVLPRLERLAADTDAPLPSAVRPLLDEAIRAGRAAAPDRAEDCCTFAVPGPFRHERPRAPSALAGARLQDQEGRELRWSEFFGQKPAVVAFFYTRCDNPNKCSLTASRLGDLQREMEARGLGGRVRVAGMTYDPAFDRPERLRAFGLNRGVAFGDDFRFFRAPDDYALVQAELGLGVNYAGGLVNRHRIELYLLDARGRIAATFQRMQWDVAAVAAELERLLSAPPAAGGAGGRWAPIRAAGALPAVALALVPKCPMCWAAYLTAAGAGGVQAYLPHGAVVPLLSVLVALHLFFVCRRARRTRRYGALAVSAAGLAAMAAARLLPAAPALAYAGPLLLLLGSLLGSLPTRYSNQAEISSSGFRLRSGTLASGAG